MIRILDADTILLNVGESNGASVGEKYTVFAEGEEIADPETGDTLGNYEFTKAIVTITKVFQRFSEAQMIEKEMSQSEKSLKTWTSGSTKIKELPIDKTQARPITSSFDPLIKVGDKARRISLSHILP